MGREFIQSRLNMLALVDESEVFMEDENDLINILELLAQVARVAYDDCCKFVISAFDALAMEYKGPNRKIEAKFCLCVYVIGAFIWAKPPLSHSEDHESFDGGNF